MRLFGVRTKIATVTRDLPQKVMDRLRRVDSQGLRQAYQSARAEVLALRGKEARLRQAMIIEAQQAVVGRMATGVFHMLKNKIQAVSAFFNKLQ